MNLPPARSIVSFSCAALLAVAGHGCGGGWPAAPACDPSPPAGELSLWTACGVKSLAGASVEFILTNDSAESVWLYHDCGDEVPWPTQLQADGTWLRLLPAEFYLAIECEHVHELLPGESGPLSMSTRHVDRPGTYRAEMMVARNCVEVHDPLHLGHACERVEFFQSEPFELR